MRLSSLVTIARPKSFWAVLGLALLCLAMRLPGILALPIFGDESIYLRWAQIVRGENVTFGTMSNHWWVSLADPKPPLHFWLIALVFRWTSDPLLSARLLSVFAGVAAVPLMVWTGQEFGQFFDLGGSQVTVRRPAHADADGRGRLVGFLAALFLIICPFVAFYQRLATQDALFVTESLAIVWLSLRWSREVMFGKYGWRWALALGIAIGAGLMTRQGVSYTLCAFPPAALLMQGFRYRGVAKSVLSDGPGNRARWVKSIGQLIFAAIIAALIWTPYLVADLHNKALSQHAPPPAPEKPVTNDELYREVKRRIMYQDSFTASSSERLNIASRNARLTFLPRWKGDDPSSGWLYFYMTPPLYFLGLLGIAWLAFRQWRVFLLVLLWTILLLGPLVLLASTIYSRYVLAGVPPLLFAAAFVMADITALLVRVVPRKPIAGAGLALVVWGAIIYLPLKALNIQATDWQHQALTVRAEAQGDKYQYINGWTNGHAVRQAIHYLKEQAAKGPIVVITGNEWGTPADALWVYLSGEPNVQIYLTDSDRVLRPGTAAGTYRLKADKWLFPPERPVTMGPGAKVFFVTNDPVHAEPEVSATIFYRPTNPNLVRPQTFYGIEGRVGEGVTVFTVNLPGS